MRVFLFGVDGLTFRILDPLIERGLLPNFEKVQNGGAHGILKSTAPPFTPPAWMSISTGMSPAKHGVYDFWTYEQTDKGPRAHSMTRRKGGKAIWNLLSEWGKRVTVANVPMTYPPEPINGIMLSGFMAPDLRADVTYPKSFKEELLETVPGYQIDINPAVESGQIGDPFAETLKMTNERVAMLRLLLKKPWDFFFIVFIGADRIQHVRWREIMEFQPQAIAYYQELDKALGIALESLQPEDLLMIVSDHGFQGMDRQFYLQEYLYRQGLLRLRDDKAHRQAVFRNQVAGIIRKFIVAIGLRGVPTLMRRQLYRLGIKTLTKVPVTAMVPDLDWANTHAWLQSASGDIAGYADIWFDDRITEEQISELARVLHEMRDPKTGKPLLSGIYREDVFGTGPFAPQERHLMLITGENTTIRPETGIHNLWNTCKPPYGIHHPDGILYLYGADVKKGETIAPAHVYDIVPTILACMGMPLPQEIDGKLIAEAFDRLPSMSSSSRHDNSVRKKLQSLATLEEV